MNLFVFAVLIAAASAARLEHLERSYLPPNCCQNVQSVNGFGSGNSRFGVNGQSPNRFGSNDGSNGFGSNGQGAIESSSNGDSVTVESNEFGAPQGSYSNGLNRDAAFGSVTSNQYLSPDHGPSGSESGSNGFNNLGSNYDGPQLGFRVGSGSSDSNGLGSSTGSQGFGSQSQFGAANPQYLTPEYTLSQNTPQQPFDEKTGYIY